MNVYEYLRDARRIDKLITNQELRIAQLRIQAERRMSKRYVQNDATIDALYQEVELEPKALIQALVDLKEMIACSIESIPDARYRTILNMRYLQNESWNAVCGELFLNRQWVWKLEQRAFTYVKIASEYSAMRSKVCDAMRKDGARMRKEEIEFCDAQDDAEAFSEM